ncbi:MAG: transposase [Owenweeksia sp.]|nr:transposase [Owenweeksia sp.]
MAISNHRIKSVEDGQVTFGYKDYRQAGKKLEMALEGMEFIRRFALHVLPKAFVRIRHYGILSSTSKKITIPEITMQIKLKPRQAKEPRKLEPYNPRICPCCKTETMVTIEIIPKGDLQNKQSHSMKNLP